MFILYLSSIDHPERENETYQRESMIRLIGNKAETTTGLFDTQNQAHDICSWTGVGCINWIVDCIHWTPDIGTVKPVRLKVIDPRWIPSTATTITIRFQRYALMIAVFSTRHLPRAAVNVDMQASGLIGSLDLQSLPVNLRVLVVFDNPLKGTVHLAHLPKQFVKLDARKTLLDSVIVDNLSLPETLKEALFEPHMGSHIDSREVSGRKIDKRVSVKTLKKH